MSTKYTIEEFMESEELSSMREVLDKPKATDLEEDDFDISTIDFRETITYPISWWIPALDQDLWWQPKWKYIMLYGGGWSWKTTLTLQTWLENARRGNKTCYLSFEMPKKEFVLQNMRKRAGIVQSWVWESTAPTDSQIAIMKKFVEEIKALDIKWYKAQPSFKQFTDIMNSLKYEWYDMIIIDNMWMIWRADGKDEMQLYWEISSFIKSYCDSTEISVLILHHTNKWWESSNGKRWFWAFRGNGKIADDCDYVVQLQRVYLESWDTQSTIKVEKDRINWRNWYIKDLIFNNWVFSWDAFG